MGLVVDVVIDFFTKSQVKERVMAEFGNVYTEAETSTKKTRVRNSKATKNTTFSILLPLDHMNIKQRADAPRKSFYEYRFAAH